MITESGLTYVGTGRATLADGSEATFSFYKVTVLWDGEPRHIRADAADITPLVGMQLLDGHDLSIEVMDGGHVVIQARA